MGKKSLGLFSVPILTVADRGLVVLSNDCLYGLYAVGLGGSDPLPKARNPVPIENLAVLFSI